MATLARLNKSKISMYPGDHNPPHFHILSNDGSEAQVAIANLALLAGGVPAAALNEALNWAMAHGALLVERWKELNP